MKLRPLSEVRSRLRRREVLERLVDRDLADLNLLFPGKTTSIERRHCERLRILRPFDVPTPKYVVEWTHTGKDAIERNHRKGCKSAGAKGTRCDCPRAWWLRTGRDGIEIRGVTIAEVKDGNVHVRRYVDWAHVHAQLGMTVSRPVSKNVDIFREDRDGRRTLIGNPAEFAEGTREHRFQTQGV